MSQVRSRPPWWVVALVLCVGAAGVAYAALDRPEDAAAPPARPPDAAAARDQAAAALLDRLSAALSSGSAADIEALAAPGDAAAARELRVLRGNVRRLRLGGLSLRYLDEVPGGPATHGAPLPAGQWVGEVRLRWRIRGYDRSASALTVTVTFAEPGPAAAFVSARPDRGSPAPLWLLTRVAVHRGRNSLAMVAGRAVGRYRTLAARAVLGVRGVLPSWRGRLVVEVPRTQRQLDRVVGSEDGSFEDIAAVTTTVDGSRRGPAPVHVFVNPPVFGRLGEQGSQIVMTHEATHVATGAATATMPTWLLEGFADYVALAGVDLPVRVTASQVLGRVLTDGVPRRLPSRAEFESGNPTLGASYEAAWLACRLLAQLYGENRLVELYEHVDRHGSPRKAFEEVLGTSQAQFTRRWRAHLERLAG